VVEVEHKQDVHLCRVGDTIPTIKELQLERHNNAKRPKCKIFNSQISSFGRFAYTLCHAI